MQIEEIDLDLIDEPEEDIREEIDLDTLEELATSIKNVGLIQPIVVFKKMKRYEVVVGHRRLIACRIAGTKTIPALIKDIKPDEIEVMKLDENIFREDISAIMIGKYINRIMKEKGLSVIEVSRYMGKTPQWTNSMLRLLDTDLYTQKAIDMGEISYAAALELQKVDNEAQRDVLTRAAVTGGAHTRVIKGWVNDYRQARENMNSEHPDQECGEKEEPAIVYKLKCKLCGRHYPVENLINIQIDPKCYPIFEEMAKNVRSQLEEGERED